MDKQKNNLAEKERKGLLVLNCAVSSLGSCCFVVRSTCLLLEFHSPRLKVVMVSSRKFLDPEVEAPEEPLGSPKSSCLRRSCNDS
ncbi:hypothetical protein IG631_11456 [Alternaria alternata]|nr:hypothetical protein IG631_11456 [Alternaria alternata]